MVSCVILSAVWLVDVLLILYIKDVHVSYVSLVDSDTVPTGILVEVKRFTENAVHRGAVSSVRFTIRSFFIFRSVRFIRSFLVPLRQIKKRKKKEEKKR